MQNMTVSTFYYVINHLYFPQNQSRYTGRRWFCRSVGTGKRLQNHICVSFDVFMAGSSVSYSSK